LSPREHLPFLPKEEQEEVFYAEKNILSISAHVDVQSTS